MHRRQEGLSPRWREQRGAVCIWRLTAASQAAPLPSRTGEAVACMRMLPPAPCVTGNLDTSQWSKSLL